MQELNGTIIYSASDLSSASDCEWAVVRKLDKMLGYDIEVPVVEDEMLQRAGKLGNIHEEKKLASLKEEFPSGVVEITRPDYENEDRTWLEQMLEASAKTIDSLRSKVPVVFQGAFFDGEFQGYADFLILNEQGQYEVNDTKLARKAKITALLQLAAYAEQLEKNDIPVGSQVKLLLGDGKTSIHELSDIMPVFKKRRNRLKNVIAERQANRVENGGPSPWNDPRYTQCGKCPVCKEQLALHEDVLLVSNLRMTQRAKLRAAGVETVSQLAVFEGQSVEGISDSTLATLRAQAVIQVASMNKIGSGDKVPAFEMFAPEVLAKIPAPNAGDIFFDFEGDPLYQEGDLWNLDYLFGFVDNQDDFTAIWAHDLAQEKEALIEFLTLVKERLQAHPDMHIYHYAPYERSHLLTLSARHGYGEAFVDTITKEGVLVDLYPVVTRSMRIGSPSYSLKILEPLYMETQRDKKGVTNAADSVTAYADYCTLRDAGDEKGAEQIFKSIYEYNKYDCISTRVLRDWLLLEALKFGVEPGTVLETKEDDVPVEPEALFNELMAKVGSKVVSLRSDDEEAVALAAAAIDYHRRENKSFWWEHFSRLSQPFADWQDTKDVCLINRFIQHEEWRQNPARGDQSQEDQAWKRKVEVLVTQAPGTVIRSETEFFFVYDSPLPPLPEGKSPTDRRTTYGKVSEVLGEGHFIVEETLPKSVPPFEHTPLAMTPGAPPDTTNLHGAIKDVGQSVLDLFPEFPANAATDILRRIAPRGPALVREIDDEHVYKAVVQSLLNQENSYVAVQGPPGTGKTYNGSKVVAQLVLEHGWKVGIVGQSHSTVENMLRGIVREGVPAELVAKKPKRGDTVGAAKQRPDTTWTPKSSLDSHQKLPGGWVIGGTAWTFTNSKDVSRESLDLLVIDEAGQFSLANTLAVSVSADRLLLLGDPQQLPQVSQGTHPEPIDRSALGWLADGAEVLPEQYGYFLNRSWRMNEAVCKVVSRLSYNNRLESHFLDREIESLAPGFFPMPVFHENNSTESVEEADAVVAQVAYLLTTNWREGSTTTPLSDVEENIIVVAPYNAQVNLLRKKLDAAGFTSIPVGTVDKFQGQEAAVSIISLAASSAQDVPRGIEFLLMQNRLNVAISRAKWAAYLYYSPELTEFLPSNVRDLSLLSQFITLTDS